MPRRRRSVGRARSALTSQGGTVRLKHLRRLFVFTLASLVWLPAASARGVTDQRLASARPGKCALYGSACTPYGRVAVLNDDCSPVTGANGVPACQSYASYICAAGYQPLYRSKTGTPYVLRSEGEAMVEQLTFFTVSTPEGCRPPRGEACFAGLDGASRTRLTKGWYCKMLNLVQGFFEDDEDLVRRLRDNAGMIARFNSTFGGAPSLKALQKKLGEYRKTLRAELNDFHRDELAGRRIGSGYYENRLMVLKELKDLNAAIFGKLQEAGRAIVRTAERGEVIAKKVQKVLIKVAGYAVFAFTGGNRIAQCLTEAGIESAANAVTQKLQGNELTLSGVGKDTLRTLIFRCADALTGGPGGDILGVLTGNFTSVIQELADKFKGKLKAKMKGFWKTIASKVGWLVDKLSFLMDDAIVKVFRHAAEEVVIEFGGEAFPACIAPLLKREWREVFGCLGRAARKALGVGVPRGLFDAAMEALENNVPKAKAKLQELASFAGLADDKTVKALLTGLTVAAKAGLANARRCRDEIQGFASVRPVFTCVARAFGTLKVETLAPIGLWEILQRALSGAEGRIVDALREARFALSDGLRAMGIPVPETLLSLLRAGSAEVARTFAKSARGCLPKAGGSAKMSDGLRSTVTCLGQAARTAFGATGHVLVAALLKEVAQAGEKGSAALAGVLGSVAERAQAAVDDIVLVPAPVKEAIRRVKGSGGDKSAKAFAAEVRKKCVRPAGKSEPLRAYIRASARCLADAATSHLKAAGAGALSKLLTELRKWLQRAGKEKGDVAASLVRRLGAVADMLGLELKLFKAAEAKVELLAEPAKFTRRVGACVGAFSQAANEAAKSRERLSSMARELRGAMHAMGRCLLSTVAKKGKAATSPAKTGPKDKAPKKAPKKAPQRKGVRGG